MEPAAVGAETRRYLTEVMAENQSLKNRVVLAEKMKTELEAELVQSKLKLAYEGEELRERMARCAQEVAAAQEGERRARVAAESQEQLATEADRKAQQAETARQKAEKALGEREREVSELERTKELVARQIEKLESDMRAWKSGTQDKLHKKELLVRELQNRISNLQDELKSQEAKANTLKHEKRNWELLANEGPKLKAAENEKKDLERKLTEEVNSRKSEVEFWVAERAGLKEKCARLEGELAQQLRRTAAATPRAPSARRESSTEREVRAKEKKLRKLAKREK